MALVLGISSDLFSDALHQAILEHVHGKRLSGSAPNRLEARGANCNIPKRVGYKYTTAQNLTVMLLQLRCR